MGRGAPESSRGTPAALSPSKLRGSMPSSGTFFLPSFLPSLLQRSCGHLLGASISPSGWPQGLGQGRGRGTPEALDKPWDRGHRGPPAGAGLSLRDLWGKAPHRACPRPARPCPPLGGPEKLRPRAHPAPSADLAAGTAPAWLAGCACPEKAAGTGSRGGRAGWELAGGQGAGQGGRGAAVCPGAALGTEGTGLVAACTALRRAAGAARRPPYSSANIYSLSARGSPGHPVPSQLHGHGQVAVPL